MNKIRLLLAGLLAALFFATAAAPATAAPVQAQAKAQYADFFYHAPVGNAQGFSVICNSDGSQKWLYQGQYSQNSGKCPYNGRVNQIFVPAGYRICMRDYYGGAGSGCLIYANGGGWASVYPGAWYAWTVKV